MWSNSSKTFVSNQEKKQRTARVGNLSKKKKKGKNPK